MNYSTLLQRSSDFATYQLILNPAYPDELDRIIGFPLLQMLWDRAEADGYAEHMTDDPYPGTPAHQVLMHVAFGDHQVANVTADDRGAHDRRARSCSPRSRRVAARTSCRSGASAPVPTLPVDGLGDGRSGTAATRRRRSATSRRPSPRSARTRTRTRGARRPRSSRSRSS